MRKNLHPSLSALLEIGLLFLPAIPAYLWVWPNLTDIQNDIFQTLVYFYVLMGTLYIGRRRWSWELLGVNRQGLGLTAACGLAILVARLLIILAINWQIPQLPLTWLKVVSDLLFYFGLVGLGEELLFRGLVYRLLEDWRGVRWAIWGSSIGFSLWHVFGQGPLMGIATLLIGLLFALIRCRAGGILGLIVLHGLWDLETVWLVSDSSAAILDPANISVTSSVMMWLGTALLVFVPVYLGWIHPRLARHKKFEQDIQDNIS